MNLFHPRTVLAVALVLVAVLQATIGAQFDRAAREASPRRDHAGFPLDDAWIHLVYARSFAERLALEYNPAQPEAGQSSLLWGVLLAPIHAIAEATGTPIGRATRVFGILIWIATALAAALFVRSLPIPSARFGAFCAALLVALDPAEAFAAASGMEPLLLSLFMLLAFRATFERRPLAAGVAAGLACLARPEGLLVAVAVVVVAWFRRRDANSLRPRAIATLLAAAPIVGLASIWVGFCLAVAGRPFPNTYYVKAASGVAPLDAIGRGADLLFDRVATLPFFESYVGYLFLAIGAVALLLRCGLLPAVALLATPLAYCVGIAATRAMLEPGAFYWARYLTPILPLVSVVTACGLAAAGAVLQDLVQKRPPTEEADDQPDEEPERDDDRDQGGEPAYAPHDLARVDDHAQPIELDAKERPPLVIPDVVLAVALAFLAVVPFFAAPRRLTEEVAEFAANVRDVDAMNVEAALWLRDESRIPPDALIAAQDAGAVRYFAGRDVLDLIGLNDHRMVTVGLSGEALLPYLSERNPRVFFLLDPDPGAVPFLLYASRLGLREVWRTGTESYSLFGEPMRRSILVLADLPPA